MININDLIGHVKKNHDKKIKNYNQILMKCHKKIKTMAKIQHNCAYEVPKSLFGIFNYNIKECVKYLCLKLEANGFEVIFVPPNIILISWAKFLSQIPKIEYTPVDNVEKKIYQRPLPIEEQKRKKNFLDNIVPIDEDLMYISRYKEIQDIPRPEIILPQKQMSIDRPIMTRMKENIHRKDIKNDNVIKLQIPTKKK